MRLTHSFPSLERRAALGGELKTRFENGSRGCASASVLAKGMLYLLHQPWTKNASLLVHRQVHSASSAGKEAQEGRGGDCQADPSQLSLHQIEKPRGEFYHVYTHYTGMVRHALTDSLQKEKV